MTYSSGTGVPSVVLWVTGLGSLATLVTPEDRECRRDPPLTLTRMTYSSGTGVPCMVLWVTGLGPLATWVTPEDRECRRDPPLTLTCKAQVHMHNISKPASDRP